MTETFKQRDEHAGPRAVHLGQDHIEKSRIEAAVPEDRGPVFHSDGSGFHALPQQPADVTHSLPSESEIATPPEKSRSRLL